MSPSAASALLACGLHGARIGLLVGAIPAGFLGLVGLFPLSSAGAIAGPFVTMLLVVMLWGSVSGLLMGLLGGACHCRAGWALGGILAPSALLFPVFGVFGCLVGLCLGTILGYWVGTDIYDLRSVKTRALREKIAASALPHLSPLARVGLVALFLVTAVDLSMAMAAWLPL